MSAASAGRRARREARVAFALVVAFVLLVCQTSGLRDERREGEGDEGGGEEEGSKMGPTTRGQLEPEIVGAQVQVLAGKWLS